MAVTLYEQARALVNSGAAATEAGTLAGSDPTSIPAWPTWEVEGAILLRDQLAGLFAAADDVELASALSQARLTGDDLLARAIEAETRRRAPE